MERRKGMFAAVGRPLALAAAGSLCAFFLCLFIPSRLFLPLSGLCILPAALSLLFVRKHARAAFVLLFLMGLFSGILWRAGYDLLFISPARSLAGCRELFSATVVEKQNYGFIIRAEAGGRQFKAFLKLYDTDNILPGDHLTFTGEIALPTTSGGFDGERYYIAKGVPVTVTPDDPPTVTRGETSFRRILYQVRHRALMLLDRLFQARAGEMSALLLGEKSLLPPGTADLLAETGLSHAFVVSGMHLSFIVSMLAFLRGRKGYLFFMLPAALFFALFSGMGLSVIRAFLMLVYASLADALLLPRDAATELCLSLLLILLWNPYALLNAGLIFSYLAVCGIFVIHPRLSSFLFVPFGKLNGLPRLILSALINAFSVSLCAGLATLPAIVFYMQRFSAVFLPANLALLWLVELLFIGGMAALFFGALWLPLGRLLALPVSGLLALFLRADSFFASLPYGQIGVESLYITLAIALSVAVLFAVCLLRKQFLRPLPIGIIVLSLLCSILMTELDEAGRDYTLTCLPSKKECALLTVQGRHILIGYDDDIEDLLRRRNISFIDCILLSGETDADGFIASFPVGEVVIGEKRGYLIGDTSLLITPEGNLLISSGETSLSVMLSPGRVYESDVYLLSREALKSAFVAAHLSSGDIYGFGTPPRNPQDSLSVTKHAYLSGELTFVLSHGKLKLR